MQVDPIGVHEMQRQVRRLCDVEGMGILITDHKVKPSCCKDAVSDPTAMSTE